jgi:hypothetical protein
MPFFLRKWWWVICGRNSERALLFFDTSTYAVNNAKQFRKAFGQYRRRVLPTLDRIHALDLSKFEPHLQSSRYPTVYPCVVTFSVGYCGVYYFGCTSSQLKLVRG